MRVIAHAAGARLGATVRRINPIGGAGSPKLRDRQFGPCVCGRVWRTSIARTAASALATRDARSCEPVSHRTRRRGRGMPLWKASETDQKAPFGRLFDCYRFTPTRRRSKR